MGGFPSFLGVWGPKTTIKQGKKYIIFIMYAAVSQIVRPSFCCILFHLFALLLFVLFVQFSVFPFPILFCPAVLFPWLE